MIAEAYTEKASNEEVVLLTPDDQALLLQELGKTALMVKTIHDEVRAGTLTKGFAAVGLGLLEFQVRDLSVKTGVPCQTAAEVEERSAKLREAQQRCIELEKQIGTASAQTDMRLAVAHHARLLRVWWRQEGFGYIQDVWFSDDGVLCAKLSGMLSPPGGILSLTPETDKEAAALWFERLVARGFEIQKNGAGRDKCVTDSPATRAALDTLMKALPSAVITEVSSHRGVRDQFTLRTIEIAIRKPAEVMALGCESAEEDF